jgi:hypothetical protein
MILPAPDLGHPNHTNKHIKEHAEARLRQHRGTGQCRIAVLDSEHNAHLVHNAGLLPP